MCTKRKIIHTCIAIDKHELITLAYIYVCMHNVRDMSTMGLATHIITFCPSAGIVKALIPRRVFIHLYLFGCTLAMWDFGSQCTSIHLWIQADIVYLTFMTTKDLEFYYQISEICKWLKPLLFLRNQSTTYQ